jgi:hypothetical protein
MIWTLFLDDERLPTYDLWQDVLIARSCDGARKLVSDLGVPSVISFDHDLGTPETGLSFLWWLIDENLDDRLDLSTITRVIVHSMNPTGAQNIAGLWNGYAKEIHSDVQAEIRPRQSLTH